MRGHSNKAIPWLRAGAAVALVSLVSGLVTGCPGSLEEVERFDPELLGLEAGACDPFGVMERKCGSGPCHDADEPAAQLDLVTDGVQERLVDVAATHADVTDPEPCNEGDILINTQNAAESWMLKKINKEHDGCGVGMPVSGRFPAADRDCLSEWILSFGSGSSGNAGSSGEAGGGAG